MDHTEYAPPKEITELTSWKIGLLANIARNAVSKRMHAEKIRRDHATVLAKLSESGPLSQADLSRALWIDPSDLHAVLNDLEAGGHVARMRDENDKRRNLIELRPSGSALHKRLAKAIQTAQAEILAPLTKAETKQFEALLAKLV
ncbi:MAG: MarR family winged helix-turn-helix transcriptional regulator [Solirubrobacterales bacterium]